MAAHLPPPPPAAASDVLTDTAITIFGGCASPAQQYSGHINMHAACPVTAVSGCGPQPARCPIC